MLSVIMPVYNCGEYLEESIKSMLCQTDTDFELIVVDDGSTDRSACIIQAYQKQHSNIHYYYQSNAGVSAARNLGISKAKGEYVTFLDADDLYVPNAIELFNKHIKEHSPDLIVHPTLRFVEDVSEATHFNNPLFSMDTVLVGEEDKKKYLYPAFLDGHKNIGCVSSWVIRRELLDKIQFDTNLVIYEDMMFFLQACKKAQRIIAITDHTYLYRYNPSGAVSSFNYKKFEDLKTTNSIIEKFHLENGLEIPKDYIFERTYFLLYSTCISSLSKKGLYKSFKDFILSDPYFSDAIAYANKERLPYAKLFSPSPVKSSIERAKILLKQSVKKLLRKKV